MPRPWYEWFQREYGHRSSRKIREYDGLWRDRLHPSQRVPQGGTEFWLIKSEADATACGADVAAQLIRAGLPRLSALLDRDQLLRAIRAGNFGFMKMPPDKALAIMLSEEGPSVELDVVIGSLEGSQWDRWKGRDDFVTWIRERSARPARP